jgi:hypothetical protein
MFPATTVVWAVNFFVKPLKLMGLLLVELVFKPQNNFHLLEGSLCEKPLLSVTSLIKGCTFWMK